MKKDYISQLSHWARWMLSRQEAEEVIADYCDIVGIPPRPKEELIRDLGKPRNVVKAIAQPKQYRIWLVVFSTLVVCVVFPVIMAYKSIYWHPIINPAYMMFLCIGVGLSLWSFRKNRERKAKLTRGIVLLLALLLIGIAGIWFLASLVLTESWEILNLIVPTTDMIQAMHLLIYLSLLSMVLITLFGLVKARLDDCRWCAVYILGFSGVLLWSFFWILFCHANLIVEPGWQTPFMLKYAFITILGFMGTGVALC